MNDNRSGQRDNLQAAKPRPLTDDEVSFDVAPELYLYRDRTTAMLRKYCQLSMELGRVPSMLGREFFRSRITSCRMHNFEDVVIFVYDMERCLSRLDEFSRQVLARIVLQEYSRTEAANMLGCALRTVERRLPEALDRLTSVLLEMDLLDEVDERRIPGRGRRNSEPNVLPPKKPVVRITACQEPQQAVLVVSSSFGAR